MKRLSTGGLVLAVVTLGSVALPSSAAAASRSARHHHAARSHRTRTSSFYARVVRSSAAGLLLRKSNGSTVYFSAHQLAHARGGQKAGQKPHRHQGIGTAVKNLRRGALQTSPTTPASGSGAAAPSVSVNIAGLQPGVTVRVTESVNADGSVTITITLPSQSSTVAAGDLGSDKPSGDQPGAGG